MGKRYDEDTAQGGDVGPKDWDDWFNKHVSGDPTVTEVPPPIFAADIDPTTVVEVTVDENGEALHFHHGMDLFDPIQGPLNTLAAEIRANAKAKGWSQPGAAKDDVQFDMTALAMVVRTVAYDMEAVRKGGAKDRMCLGRTMWAEGESDAGRIDPAKYRLLTALALIVTEVVEGMDAVIQGSQPSEHCPEMTALAEELADILIRTLDLCADMGFDADEIVRAKMNFNATRPAMHGGKKV